MSEWIRSDQTQDDWLRALPAMIPVVVPGGGKVFLDPVPLDDGRYELAAKNPGELLVARLTLPRSGPWRRPSPISWTLAIPGR
jgi:hypothetical protein